MNQMTIDQGDQRGSTHLHVIIHRIVPEIMLAEENGIMDNHHVNVTTLHITHLHETTFLAIVTTYHLVVVITHLLGVITSYHELTLTSI